MGLKEITSEIIANLEELRRQYGLKRLRRYLKYLLIGFLIGRNSDKRISELTRANELLVKSVCEHFEQLEKLCSKIKDFADAYRSLADVEARLKGFGDQLECVRDSAFGMKMLLKEHNELLGQLGRIVEQKQQELTHTVEKVRKSGTYLTYIEKDQILASLKSFEDDLQYCVENSVLEGSFIIQERKKLEGNRDAILGYSREFIERRKKEYQHLWRKGLLTLDDEQQTAIVTDDLHNLVVAAAGSGKTEVLITRIAYLTARKPDGVRSERILAIAYQRKAKEEIENRLHERYGIEKVSVRTFHKLGKDILESAGKRIARTDIIDDNKKHEIVKGVFEQWVKSDLGFYELFLDYVKTLHNGESAQGEKQETLAYTDKHDYIAIDGHTRVHSRAEKEIMDFLSAHKLNGQNIEVQYEPDVAGLFRPDFYFPQYDMFIEHWAINEKGEVPKHFQQTSEQYRKTMDTKRRWFADNNRMLVETFAYEYAERSPKAFIELLKARILTKLRERSLVHIEFTPKTYEEIVELAWGSCHTPVEDLMSYITTAKTYDLTPKRLEARLNKMKWSEKQLAFGKLALPVYQAYEQRLVENNKIDFEDMINRAIEVLESNQHLYAGIYDHILVDEYQDISAQRLKLTKELLRRNPGCKLFCVGDDWQSIMSFSGSNLHFFVNFEQYFEKPAITRISTNYRSAKSIVDAGAQLIKNNTSCQVQKPSRASRNEVRPIRVLRSPHRLAYEERYNWQIAEDCMKRVQAHLRKGYAPNDILVLTRYIRTKVGGKTRFPKYIQALIEEANKEGIEIVCDNSASRSKIRLLTVHKCKGLEARAVFILNVTKGTFGFPCEIEDSSILEPARENYPPQDKREEERRLFYVALTRAKEDLYIYTWEDAKSEFLKEIQDHTEDIRLNY